MNPEFYGLWYRQPAAAWEQALPVGNGRFGGMIYGGVQQETIALNEETVWNGVKRDRNNPDAFQRLGEIRNAIFSGQYQRAEDIGAGMLGIPSRLESYQPLCELTLSFPQAAGDPAGYRRALDLTTALHTVYYQLGSVRCRREAFVSAPDQIMVIRLEAEGGQGIDVGISLSRPAPVEVTAEENWLLLTGRCCQGGTGFAAAVQATAEGGEIFCQDGALEIRGACSIELRVSGATDFAGGSAVQKCLGFLQAASTKSYALLRQRHIADYQSLYNRQRFSLGGEPSRLPTDALLRDFAAGKRDNTVYELWYHYLRYQLICSSRPGCLPSNLQGIWNSQMKAPWNSDFHPNVNLQINYWPAEGYNLPECVEPLIAWIQRLVPNGEKTARIHYHARGWVLHHVSDLFGCTTPMDGLWGLWPLGGAWLCRHLYEHYLYGGGEQYLRETALPVIEGAVLFMLDFLIPCPQGLPGEGHLVTCPSHSPENRFKTPDGQLSWLTYAATMDMEIIYDLFTIYLDCLKTLKLESPYREAVLDARSRLVPLKISPKTGCLQEWIADYEEEDLGHRHVSHLYALYPGNQITQAQTPLFNACQATLDRRLSHDYKAQGWSCGWIAVLLARLQKGDRALALLEQVASNLTYENLFVNAHGHPQVGDAQSTAAAMQEMLVQSHEGMLRLLPALPSAWPNGEVEGLRVRGGHLVNLYWKNGRLEKAVLTAACDGPIVLCTTLQRVQDAAAALVPVERDAQGAMLLQAKAGERYTLL